MPAQVQNLAQEIEHADYVKRINDLTFEANTNLLDIEIKQGSNIEAAKLTALRASLNNIELKMSTAYT